MAPSKKGVKKPSRKNRFRGIQFQKMKILEQKRSSLDTVSNTATGSDDTVKSASRRKLEASDSLFTKVPPLEGNVDFRPQGYRLIDLVQLAAALKSIKLCNGGKFKDLFWC